MSKYIDIHTHNVKNKYNIISYRFGVDNIDTGSCYCVAIHPWDSELHGDKIDRLREFIESNKVIAIGETGLDFSVAKTPYNRNIQRNVFIEQVKLANNLRLPIFVHSVRSNSEVYSVIKRYNKGSNIIIHGFVGSIKECNDFLAIGCFLSFSLRVLSSPKSIEAFKLIPLDRVFCETDAADVTIESVYSELARLRGCDIEKIKLEIEINYRNFFKNE